MYRLYTMNIQVPIHLIETDRSFSGLTNIKNFVNELGVGACYCSEQTENILIYSFQSRRSFVCPETGKQHKRNEKSCLKKIIVL